MADAQPAKPVNPFEYLLANRMPDTWMNTSGSGGMYLQQPATLDAFTPEESAAFWKLGGHDVTNPASATGPAAATSTTTTTTPSGQGAPTTTTPSGQGAPTGGATTMSYPTSIDPSVVSYFNSKVAENPYDQTLGQLQYVDPKTGLQYFGRFEQGPYGGEGSTPAMKLTGYSVGNYETAKGGQMGVYDLAGKYTGKNEDWEADDWNYDTQAMMAAISFGVAFAAAAAAAGGAASGAGGGTAAGPDFTAGFTDTGTAGGALDSYAGSAAVTEPAGSTLLTGPTSVSADYNLLTGTNISDPSGVGFGLEGNAGQGINVAGRSGDGLVMNQSGNLPAMGGGQGLTTTGTQVMGDAGSFINNPAYQLEGAGNTIISEGGIYTPQSPYTPDLGDPNSFINRPAPDVPTGPADLPISDPSLLDKIKDILDPTKVLDPTKILPTILPPLIQKLLEPPEEQPPQPVTFTPEQPFVGVGAGEYTQANAQGGAAGSMAGVAGTLLTAKDTFGYGRTMLA